jgi:hypothetical protein
MRGVSAALAPEATRNTHKLQRSSTVRKLQHSELYRKGSALFGKEYYHTVLHNSSATEPLQFPEPEILRLVLEP